MSCCLILRFELSSALQKSLRLLSLSSIPLFRLSSRRAMPRPGFRQVVRYQGVPATSLSRCSGPLLGKLGNPWQACGPRHLHKGWADVSQGQKLIQSNLREIGQVYATEVLERAEEFTSLRTRCTCEDSLSYFWRLTNEAHSSIVVRFQTAPDCLLMLYLASRLTRDVSSPSELFWTVLSFAVHLTRLRSVRIRLSAG